MLVNIVSNKTQDLTWRDYALQVFPAYAARTTDRADSENQALRTVIDAALTERGTVLPGTALIAMNRLSGVGGLYETNTDATNALTLARTMARNEANPVLECMSAMAALGQVGDVDDLKWLKEMASRAGQDKRLQTAANYNHKHLAQRVKL
jgi:hypothetical protein